MGKTYVGKKSDKKRARIPWDMTMDGGDFVPIPKDRKNKNRKQTWDNEDDFDEV